MQEGDDSPRKVIALAIWVALLVFWLGRAIYQTWIKKMENPTVCFRA
jgi:hypothetical protein